jgi:hypothetical protein
MSNISNMGMPLQPQPNKINSDTSSISISSDKNHAGPRLHSGKIFNTNNTLVRNSIFDNESFNKKRKRYIKNNKFVYVHPGSAAAKRLEMEKVININFKSVNIIFN